MIEKTRNTPYNREYLLSSKRPLVIESTLIIGSTSRHFLSSGVPFIIVKISRHQGYLLPSGVPLVIQKTSTHQQYFLSLGVSLIIGKISSLGVPLIIREYLS